MQRICEHANTTILNRYADDGAAFMPIVAFINFF